MVAEPGAGGDHPRMQWLIETALLALKLLTGVMQYDPQDPTVELKLERLAPPDHDDQQPYRITLEGAMHYELLDVLEADLDEAGVKIVPQP